MGGNIATPELDRDNPLIPAEAFAIRDLLDSMANAKVQVLRTDQVGDIGAYIFRVQGGSAIAVLPLKSPTVLPAMSGSTAPAAIDVEATLTVSAVPTQAEVQAIRDYARSVARMLDALIDILRANTFPS